MKINQKVKEKIEEILTDRNVRKQAKSFALESNLEDKEKFVQEFMHMYKCKKIIGRYVVKFTASDMDENENIAVNLLGSILNSVLVITTNDNPDYSFRAVETLGKICFDITKECGTASDQFELMALMTKYNLNEETEEYGEDEDG